MGTNILEGSILVTVLKGTDLKKKGLFGKPDPYVVLKLGDQTKTSQTIDNNPNPEWNYETTFDLSEDASSELSLEVFDKDIGKDDALGNTSFPISKIVDGQFITEEWIPLDKSQKGKILVS